MLESHLEQVRLEIAERLDPPMHPVAIRKDQVSGSPAGVHKVWIMRRARGHGHTRDVGVSQTRYSESAGSLDSAGSGDGETVAPRPVDCSAPDGSRDPLTS